jgi:tRNA G18 (ribose-2'-O)-methylase SpoU
MKANAESLNAASAGSILLFEAVRQRLMGIESGEWA